MCSLCFLIQAEDTFQKGQEKDKEDHDSKSDIKGEDNAIEMSEDFDGKMHDGELEEQGLRLSVTAFLLWKIIILIRKLCVSNKEPVVLLESFGPSWLFCITVNEDISTYAHAITISTQVEVHSQSWRFFAEEPETLADAPAASLLNAVSGYCPSGKSKKRRRRS